MPKVKSFGTLSRVAATKAMIQVDSKCQHPDLNAQVVQVRLADVIGEGTLMASHPTASKSFCNQGDCDDLTKFYNVGDYVQFTAKRSGKTHHPWYAFIVEIIDRSGEANKPIEADGEIVTTSEDVIGKACENTANRVGSDQKWTPASWAVVRTMADSVCGAAEALLTEEAFVYPALVAFNINYIELLVERQKICLKLQLLDPIDRWIHKFAPQVKYRVVSARLRDPLMAPAPVFDDDVKVSSKAANLGRTLYDSLDSKSLDLSCKISAIENISEPECDGNCWDWQSEESVMDLKLLERSGVRIYGGGYSAVAVDENVASSGQSTFHTAGELGGAELLLPHKKNVGIQADELVTSQLHSQIVKVLGLVTERLNAVELEDLCRMCPDLMDLALDDSYSPR